MEVPGFSPTSPAGLIIQHIRRNGKTTVKELETVLGVSTTAVREHLANLQSQGLIASTMVRYGPGRPRHVYSLTDKAHRLFPRHYDLLINLILQELARRDGVEKVEQLLGQVGHRLAQEYASHIRSEDIPARLDELRAMLEKQGIPSDVQRSTNGIQIFSCPYHDVAQEHAEVCSMDRQVFEQVVGEKLVQEHSIREGHPHCCFHVVSERKL
jgi:predicted ArsR family transcriptional regulator